MSVEANKATVRRVAEEIFSQRQMDVIDDIFAPHYVGHTQHGTVVHGAAGLKQFVAQYLAAFSHTQSVVEDQVAEGDRVVVRLTFTGTHTGPWMGIPPTGKPVTVKGMALYRLQDGEIVEQWTIGDTLGLLQQLGAVAWPMHSGEPPAH
jgi:steroid delta-isomerase-like uncharacterized protein